MQDRKGTINHPLYCQQAAVITVSERHAIGAMIAQIHWTKPVTFLSDLRPTPQHETYTWHHY